MGKFFMDEREYENFLLSMENWDGGIREKIKKGDWRGVSECVMDFLNYGEQVKGFIGLKEEEWEEWNNCVLEWGEERELSVEKRVKEVFEVTEKEVKGVKEEMLAVYNKLVYSDEIVGYLVAHGDRRGWDDVLDEMLNKRVGEIFYEKVVKRGDRKVIGMFKLGWYVKWHKEGKEFDYTELGKEVLERLE